MSLMKYSQEYLVLEPRLKVEPTDFSFKPFNDQPFTNFKFNVVHLQLFHVEKEEQFRPFVEVKQDVVIPPPAPPVHRSSTIGENGLHFLSFISLVGIWNDEEHKQFMKGYKKHGRNWSLISKEFVPTRTRQQVRSHAQKFFRRNNTLEDEEE
jgi:SHAQKYF class myb-like DNA-binding protein